MRKPALQTVRAQLIAACSLALLALPASRVLAQEEEEGGDDLDQMMQTDPDRPAKEESEDEGEDSDEAAQGEDEERASSGEQGSDEERPPGEPEDDGKEDKPVEEAAPVDAGAKGFGLGGLVGYGISLEDGANVWSFGFGLQGGYDLGVFVVGARFVYYIGGSEEIPKIDVFQQVTGTETVTANLWELGVDLAFDIDLSPVTTLRPGLGIGFASVSAGSTSKVYGAFSPGVALLYDVSPSFYIGLDARLQVVTAEPEVAKGLIFLGAFGLRV